MTRKSFGRLKRDGVVPDETDDLPVSLHPTLGTAEFRRVCNQVEKRYDSIMPRVPIYVAIVDPRTFDDAEHLDVYVKTNMTTEGQITMFETILAGLRKQLATGTAPKACAG